MFIYDDYRIIDNFSILRNVKDILGEEKYKELLTVWSEQNKDNIRQVLKGRYDEWTYSLIEALLRTAPIAHSLIKDDLFGIYIGIIPSSKYADETNMPYYFIFRCSNNGRSVVVSEIEI